MRLIFGKVFDRISGLTFCQRKKETEVCVCTCIRIYLYYMRHDYVSVCDPYKPFSFHVVFVILLVQCLFGSVHKVEFRVKNQAWGQLIRSGNSILMKEKDDYSLTWAINEEAL